MTWDDTVRNELRTKNLAGQKFGKYKVISFALYKEAEDSRSKRPHKDAHWKCKCIKCGEIRVISHMQLQQEKTSKVHRKKHDCTCDRKRKMFRKVYKKFKQSFGFELSLDEALEICGSPCTICGKTGSYTMEDEEGIAISYNGMTKDLQPCCEEHR